MLAGVQPQQEAEPPMANPLSTELPSEVTNEFSSIDIGGAQMEPVDPMFESKDVSDYYDGLSGSVGDTTNQQQLQEYSLDSSNMMATGTSVSELESGGGEENLAEGEGNPKYPTTTLSAGGVGAVTGFCVAGPVGAVVVGTGWAYVASRPGKGGEIARASGRTLRATAAACTTLASVTVAKMSSVNGKYTWQRQVLVIVSCFWQQKSMASQRPLGRNSTRLAYQLEAELQSLF